MERDISAHNAFSQLSIVTNLNDDIIAAFETESFVSTVYGKKKLKEVDKVKLHIFLEKYKPKNGNENISCIKKLDGNALLSCHRVLLQKMKRTSFIVKAWMSSVSSHPPKMDATDHRCKIVPIRCVGLMTMSLNVIYKSIENDEDGLLVEGKCHLNIFSSIHKICFYISKFLYLSVCRFIVLLK